MEYATSLRAIAQFSTTVSGNRIGNKHGLANDLELSLTHETAIYRL